VTAVDAPELSAAVTRLTAAGDVPLLRAANAPFAEVLKTPPPMPETLRRTTGWRTCSSIRASSRWWQGVAKG
jgi:hypothetical protein